jgi:hypothetical protein
VARLLITGFEFNEGASKASNSPEPGLSASGTGATATIQSLIARSGGFAAKLLTGASGSNAVASIVGVSFSVPTTLFYRAYVRVDAWSAATQPIMGISPDSSPPISTRLTAAGKIQLWTSSQQGSDSAGTITPGDTNWYRLEMSLTYNASVQITAAEVRLDGVSVATVSGLTLTNGTFRVGATTANQIVYVDDIGVNDSTGAAQNSFPGSGKVVLLVPISLNANGGSWTDDAAARTSAALTNAINNTPPKGIADTTAGGGDHQDRNAAANTSLDMNMTSYATAGVAAADTVNAVTPWIAVSAPVVTGAKTGSVGVVSNPAITNIAFVNGGTSAANFWGGTAAGTYPTGWRWEKGTVTINPSVTVGTSPVMRVTITGGTTSRVAMTSAMFMYVDYTPSAVVTPPPPTVKLQAVNRASCW